MSFQCWVEEGEGMSDLSMYELEDIVWDEFGQSDDHIVPHPSDEHENEQALQGENRKKPRREVIGVSSNVGDQAAKCVTQVKEERDFPTLNSTRDTMMGNDPWSLIPDDVFSASCDTDSTKEVEGLASNNNTRMLNHCFSKNNLDSCADDPILGDRCTAVDLSLFDNDHDKKQSSDLLYYGWPDIGNFEDVDRMLRSCDAAFELGGSGNGDELGWFSSSNAIEGSEDALKTDFKFLCTESNEMNNISGKDEASNLNNERSSINASSWAPEIDEPAMLGHSSSVNVPNQSSEIKDEFMLKGVEFNNEVQFKMSTINHSIKDNRMINLHNKQSKHDNHREERIKDQCLENGGSFHHTGNLQNDDIHLHSGDTSHQVLTSGGICAEKQNLGRDSFSYLHANSCMQSNYCHSSDQTTTSPTVSSVRSEINDFASKESSYSSNQVHSVDSSHDPSFEATTIKLEDEKEKLHAQKGFQPPFTSNPEYVDLAVQSSICDPVSVRKQDHYYGSGLKNQSDVKGVSLAENVQESSSMNSGLDEFSLVATSFCQLQQVMEQLDIRTKLCIRDSLYRLARSAEQRHNYANLNGNRRDHRDISGALIAEVTNKCTGFMDLETDTNPIDRSIAHLLFHRPSDSLAHNAQSHKSHAMINVSIPNRPVMGEKLVCGEETATETDRKVADN